MSISVNFKVDTNRIAVQLFQSVQNLSPVLSEWGKEQSQFLRDNFDNEADPETGKKWKALTAKTLERKKRLGAILSILQETGEMRASIKSVVRGQQGDPIVDIGVFNETIPRARAHQFGAPQNNLPARPFIGLPDKAYADLKKRLRKAFKPRGFA